MSMMNRRRFLAWLGGTAAGVAAASTLDLDKLLWVPGEKTIFIPSVKLAPVASMDALALGDIFTIEGFFDVSPGARKGQLQQMTVMAISSTGPSVRYQATRVVNALRSR